MRSVRALPLIQLTPAASSRHSPDTAQGRTSRKERAAAPSRREHPIGHHVAGPARRGPEHPDKAGRRRAPPIRSLPHRRKQ
jgi:hypothetical protein